jgi:glycosyltransferase involved in cell wall biosynthesis
VYLETVKLPKSEFQRLSLFKKTAHFDAVLLQKKTLNAIDSFLLRKYAKKIIYDFDDAVMFSPNKPQVTSRSHLKPFIRTAKMVNLIIAGNSYLAEQAQKYNRNVVIIPTGLDIKPYDITPDRDDNLVRLVWIGSKSTLKYLLTLKPALERIGREFDNVVLRIICDDFFDLENMPVEKCPWSLETQATHLAQSDIGLAPLTDNKFTRGKCGFKIIQYLATSLPTVASPVGANADIIQDSDNGLLATTDDQWFHALTKLITNKNLRQTLGAKAKQNAKTFDINKISQKLATLLT